MSQQADRARYSRDIQRSPPFGRLTPRRSHVLRADQIQPVIRIAHRLDGIISMNPRLIVDHELVLFRQARGHMTLGDVTIPLRDGLLVVIPPFIPHVIRCPLDGLPADHVAVHFDLAPDIPPAATGLTERRPYDVRVAHCEPLPTSRSVPAGSDLDRALLRIVDLRHADDPISQAEASAELSLVLLRLLRDSRLDRDDDENASEWQQQRMQRVTDWIDQHYAETTIQVADLAELAGLSPSHFSRVFSKWAGYSPMDYLKRTRIEQARRLLANTDQSVKAIASATGFGDPYHFSRVFRQVDGLTATQYREAAHAAKTQETDSE